MRKQLIIMLYILSGICAYSQTNKVTGVAIVDSVLKHRKSNRKITGDSFNGISYKNESVSGVKFFATKSEVIKKFGKGELIKKKFLHNMLDIDNPTIYYRSYLKYNNSLFEIDNKDRFSGFELKDALYVLDNYQIHVGESLESLAKKLPKSLNEIEVGEHHFTLMIRLLDFDCVDCSAHIILYIDRKSKKLVSIEQRIHEDD